MATPLILYSCGTFLAYCINKKFYRDKHWVWCGPDFYRRTGSPAPPTSCAGEIYHSLWKEVDAGDLHSAKVEKVKSGITRGAVKKRESNVINRQQQREILAAVERAQVRDFMPLVYVIPFDGVRRIAKPVPPEKKAHAMAEEYIIKALPRQKFDIIQLMRPS